MDIDVKKGDDVRVFDVNGRRMGQTLGDYIPVTES
jgi:hypothetical protein